MIKKKWGFNSKVFSIITLVMVVFCFIITSLWSAKKIDFHSANAKDYISLLDENDSREGTSMGPVFGLTRDEGFTLLDQGISVPASQPPIADFSASSTFISRGDSVTFTDQSVNDPTSWDWTFEGGTPATSTAQNPTVTYNTVGTYNVTLVATNAQGSDSETKPDYIVVVGPYCTSSGSSQNYEYIAGVAVGVFYNPSGASPYTDFTDLEICLIQGNSTSISLTPGFTGSSYTEYWKIWIDYNGDHDFEDAGEEVFSGSGSSVVTGGFTVPTSTITGNTRMRVSMSYNTYPPQCGTFTYGEVEDYTVNIYDNPAETMPCIEGANQAHYDQIQERIGNVHIDYHPEHGIIPPDQYPVIEGGITPQQAEAQLILELEAEYDDILELGWYEYKFTGRALVEHLKNDVYFYVWHEYIQETTIIFMVMVIENGECYLLIRVWIQTCANGAGYWAWISGPIPCPPGIYNLHYYSTPELLSPSPTSVWPELDPAPTIDPTGTLQEVHALNVAHRERIADFINRTQLDYHPVHGYIGPFDYKVCELEMTADDAHAWIVEQTQGMDLKQETIVDTWEFSGRALAEHEINGEQVLVWHDYENVPIIYARAVAEDPPDSGNCYLYKGIWIKTCGNRAGYWSTIHKEIPCPPEDPGPPNITVDYSVIGGRIRPNIDCVDRPAADFSASATTICAGQSVSFTDLSTGNPTSWLWTFEVEEGTAPLTSTSQNPTVTYHTVGTYSVSLTVKNASCSDTETKSGYITVLSPTEIYVYDITQNIKKTVKYYKSRAVVTIWDTCGAPVANATVYITWSGVVSGSASGVTGADGTVTFISSSVKSGGPFTITVDNVTHATKTYNPALNNETSDTITY